MEIKANDVYRIVFKAYPDVLNVKQASEILGISTKTMYKLIKSGDLSHIKVGREFRIPKVVLMKYIKVFGAATV